MSGCVSVYCTLELAMTCVVEMDILQASAAASLANNKELST